MEDHVAADYEKTVTNGGALLSVDRSFRKVDETTIRQTLEKYGAARVKPILARLRRLGEYFRQATHRAEFLCPESFSRV